MNGQSTKEKILIAARKLFIENGFSGTSMGKIAKLAHVNHSLLFHHFGNKENLWVEVKQTIVKDNQQQSKMLPELTLPFPDFLRTLINKSIRFYRDNPDIIRMINWQRLEYNESQKIGLSLSQEAQEWIDAFKHYQKKGDINKSLKPEFIITFVLSIVSSAALDQNVFVQNEAALKKYIEFSLNQLLKGLT